MVADDLWGRPAFPDEFFEWCRRNRINVLLLWKDQETKHRIDQGCDLINLNASGLQHVQLAQVLSRSSGKVFDDVMVFHAMYVPGETLDLSGSRSAGWNQ